MGEPVGQATEIVRPVRVVNLKIFSFITLPAPAVTHEAVDLIAKREISASLRLG